MPKLTRSELANLAVGLPIMTSIIGLMVGIGIGFGSGWAMKPKPIIATDEQVANLDITAFSAEQIEFKCGQIRGEELKSANERIAALEKERDDYEKRVLDLETKLANTQPAPKPSGRSGGSRGPSSETLRADVSRLQGELNDARDQLAKVTFQLDQAEREKKQLQEALVATSTRLRETEGKLDVQVQRTRTAEQDAMGQKWWRFISDAQLEICEKGNRKKMGRCRETVQGYLKQTPLRNKFVHCVRSKQATPGVQLLGKEEKLPRFAGHIDQDNRIVRDWYIQLCDPTLPEAQGLAGPG